MIENVDIDKLQSILKKLGEKTEYADMRIGSSKNNSIVMKDSKIDKIDTGVDFAIGIRVLHDGAWGSAFTTQIDKVQEIADKALLLSSQLDSDVELTEANPHEDIVKSKAKLNIDDVPIEEKTELMKEADKAGHIDKITSVSVNYSEAESTNILISTEGTNITTENNRVAMFMNSVASNGELIQIGHKSVGGVKGFELIQNTDLEKFGRGISEKAIKLLDAKTPPSGDFPVILDPDLSGVDIKYISIEAFTITVDYQETWDLGLNGFYATGRKVNGTDNLYKIEVRKADSGDGAAEYGLANIDVLTIKSISIQ